MSRFHTDTLRALGIDGVRDPSAMRALASRATALGVTFPASFAEWYGMQDGIELLRRHSNCDDPLPIDKLGGRIEWPWPAGPDWVAGGLLLFMVENQAVCFWALRLDAGDDPPVLVARVPDFAWRPCAESFSTFIGCQVWDHTEVFSRSDPPARILLQAQDGPLRSEELAFLRQGFKEQPTTHGWPGENAYRFEREDARILVWDAADQADWFIASASESDLEGVVAELWQCGGLRGPLYSNDPRGEAVLEALRSARGPS